MSVEKFRSIEEMHAALILTKESDGFERFLRHCARYWALAPRSYPRGVFKFHTIDEAQAAREREASRPGRSGGSTGSTV